MSKMQQKGKVGDLLAHRFEELGVKDYFVVPGLYHPDCRYLGANYLF